jgi:phosphoribosyl 1,2-cyclic phosphodiesterase
MSVKFCVLGSGSEGNAALLMTPDSHVLIDAGFLPNEMAARMEGTGASWDSLDAVVLTHTHGDHLKKKCLTLCQEREIPFFCNAGHAAQLCGSRYFNNLNKRGLVRSYTDEMFEITPDLRFLPIPLPHDCPPTFGFRIEARRSSAEIKDACGADSAAESAAPYARPDEWAKLAYLADLGDCAESIAHSVADVDLLALEFNHDEKMQLQSGRHPKLIQRVLGPHGHLSNRQAAEVFKRIMDRGVNGGPKLLLQMHLSRDCNRADLAYQAAQQVVLLTGAQTRVFSTRQDRRGTIHHV